MKASEFQTEKSNGKNYSERISKRRCPVLIILVVSAELFVRCAPVAYELQSARMAGRHQIEITPSYTKVQVQEKVSEEKKPVTYPIATKAYGIQAAYGLTDKLDLRFRMVTFYAPQATKTVFSTGLKVRLVKDRVAAYFPLWFVDNRPAQFQPTLLLSFPLVKDRVEFNPSGKVLLSLAGNDPTAGFLLAANFGLAFSTNTSRWALRPEYSIIYAPGKTWTGSFSVGLTFKLNASSL